MAHNQPSPGGAIGFEMYDRPEDPPPIGFEGVSSPAPVYPTLPASDNGPMQPEPITNDDIPDGAGVDNKAFVLEDTHTPQRKATVTGFSDKEDEDATGSLMSESKKRLEEMYFKDGGRRIDYVLAYTDTDPKKAQKRQKFEESLIEEGLELEHEDRMESKSRKTYFVKIHAPWEVCTRYAELMNMKMPIKEVAVQENFKENDLTSSEDLFPCIAKIPNPFEYDKEYVPEEPNYFTCAFNRERANQFIIVNQESFFTPSQRSRIVYEILSRAKYDNPEKWRGTKEAFEAKMRFGIVRLLGNSTYTAAFPLHEGNYITHHSILTHGAENERKLLYEVWAKPRNWYKQQPLDLIRKYYGEKIGIYFAWLGFYTIMLVPAAVVGLICFLYGLCTLFGNIPSDEICNKEGPTVMCPLCDLSCPYWYLKSSCLYSRLTHLFDNPATVFFSIFMALWATLFLEFWKRKQFVIAWDWDVMDFEDEGGSMRPQYEAQATKTKKNPINQMLEPVLPWWNALTRRMASVTSIVFMLVLVLAAVFGVIVYRIVMVSVMYASNVDLVRQNAKLTTTFTAATINLIVILILSRIYRYIAVILTELECPRTQQDYEDSFTFKMFLFQFVNFYSSLIYIAFLKGRFVNNPSGASDYKIFGYRMDQCDPAGCLIELCIQLGIIMVGKQVMNNFMELGLPMIKNFIAKRTSKLTKKSTGNETDEQPQGNSRWELDYALQDNPPLGLFDEYLEMVIQYGFVTLFVAAFPLAPLCALLNNVIEIRLDAYKYVTQFRRSLAVRAQDIGAWYGILKALSILAVISNAFVISYTSDFIPRLVFLYEYSPDDTMNGYVNNSLSYFNSADFPPGTAPDKYLKANEGFENVTSCRYRGYDHPPGHPNQYEHTAQYWHIVAARVIFIVIFEHLVFFLTGCISMIIPDTPQKVKDQILREKFLAKEALYRAELEKTKLKRELSDEAESGL